MAESLDTEQVGRHSRGWGKDNWGKDNRGACMGKGKKVPEVGNHEDNGGVEGGGGEVGGGMMNYGEKQALT